MKWVYMLDTDTVSYALRGVGRVGATIVEHPPSALCVSSITVAELRFGAARRKSPKLAALIETFLASVAVAPFDDQAAGAFGVLAAELVDSGTPIGDFDTLIAAHALSLDLTLVTNNRRHFERVAGLRFESWN